MNKWWSLPNFTGLFDDTLKRTDVIGSWVVRYKASLLWLALTVDDQQSPGEKNASGQLSSYWERRSWAFKPRGDIKDKLLMLIRCPLWHTQPWSLWQQALPGHHVGRTVIYKQVALANWAKDEYLVPKNQSFKQARPMSPEWKPTWEKVNSDFKPSLPCSLTICMEMLGE